MGRRRTDARLLTAAGFEHLLACLDADADRAASEYERLRLTLVKFFDWRGAWAPDECADETLDRLVLKLQSETTVDDIRRYARGIARLVLLERLRRQEQVPIDRRPQLPDLRDTSPSDASDPLHECFEQCLARLPAESRTLVLHYYGADGRGKIDDRRRLARSAGISPNALRSRVQRLRARLERCTETCAAAAEALGLERALLHVTTGENTIEMKMSDGD